MLGLRLQTFRFWCQKVLPLVYDDSLSYYELLCKCRDYINELIENGKIIGEELVKLENEMQEVLEYINNFDTHVLEDLLAKYFNFAIFVDISEAGYITYHIPESWEDIHFHTTGLDIEIEGVDYGHLALTY